MRLVRVAIGRKRLFQKSKWQSRDGWILTVFYQQLNRGEKTRLMATKWRLR